MPRKQGTILGLMLGAVGLLLLGQVFAWAQNRPPETGVVRLYVGEPVLISGAVQVEAAPIDLPEGDDWTLCVQPGQRVAAGQVLYQKDRPRELENLALSVRLLRGAAEAEKTAVSRRTQLLEAIGALSGGEIEQRPDLAEQAAMLVLAEQDRETLSADLDRAEAILLGYGAEARQTVTADRAGIFTGDALVTGDRWFLETELPFALAVGQTLEAALQNGIFETVTMTVEAVEDGKTVLSCGACLSQVSQLTTLTAKILKDSESGLEIPARAVYTVGEETGVYVYSGGSAHWRPVTILRQRADTVIVQANQPEGPRPGDQVLLEG